MGLSPDNGLAEGEGLSSGLGLGGSGLSIAQAFLQNFPLLSNLIDSVTSDSLTLTRASSKTFIKDSGALETVTSGNAAFTGSGVLIEPSHTNKLTYSQQFDNAAWTKDGAGCSVTANAGTAPDGTTTADQVNAGTSGSGNIQQAFTVTGTSTCGIGVFVKAGSVNYATLRSFDTGFIYGSSYLHVDLTNGNIVASANVGGYTVEDQGVIDCGSGWYYIYQTISGIDRPTLAIIYPANSTSPFNNANGNNILAWQFNAFEDAIGNLSSVPTTTAAATSLKDDLAWDLSRLPANDFEISFNWTPKTDGVDEYQLSLSSGANGLELYLSGGFFNCRSTAIASSGVTPNTTYPVKLTKSSSSGFTLTITGVGTDTDATDTGDITWPATGYIGSRYTGALHITGVIDSLKVTDL